MKVSTLQLFLRSLRSAVTAADGNSSLPADLEAVSAGLAPFAELDFGRFAAFLRQAEQYRDSGAVSVPLPGPGAENVQMGLRTAASLADKFSSTDGLDVQQATADRDRTRQDLEQALAAFLKPLAINITLKGDQKGFEATLKNASSRAHAAQIRAHASQIRAALDGATDEASLRTPEREGQLQAIVDRLELPDLKAVATELGAPGAKGGKDAILAAIVERVTGIKPAAKKSPRASRTAAVDQAAIQQQAVKLKGLLEKSVDPDGLSDADVDAAINELKTMNQAELQAVAEEAGLDNVGKKKADILKKIGLKLTEARRARESIEV